MSRLNNLHLPPGAAPDPITIVPLEGNTAQPIVVTVPTSPGTADVRVYGGLTPLEHVAAVVATGVIGSLAPHSGDIFVKAFPGLSGDEAMYAFVAKGSVTLAQFILDECKRQQPTEAPVP